MGVRITGVGIHPFGRFEGKTPTDMGVHAVRAALAEAGNPSFQAAFCGTAYGGVASGHKVLGALALTGVPIVDVEAGCASGGAALQLAAGAIRAGQYDCALVFGVEKMPKGIIRSSFFEPWREEAGLAATPAYFALRAQRLLREAGLDKHHLAEVVVKNRRNGVHNPDAMFRKEVTVDEVLASRRRVRAVASLDAVLAQRRCGGARARTRRTAASSSRRPRLRSHLPGQRARRGDAPLRHRRPRHHAAVDVCGARRVRRSGRRSRRARCGRMPGHRRGRELLAYQELDLCPPGGQAKLLAEPRVVVNPSGGLLSKGEPLGASALGQVVELVHQLRSEAGPRQVEDARVGLAHTVGRGANAACIIVTR